MAKQKISDFRNMTEDELHQNARNLEEQLFKLRCELQGGRIEKPHKIKLAKKDLARINTILRERKK